jgi:hypothetical protein
MGQMAEEGSGTDEKVAKPIRRARDLDTVMLFGCSGFVLVCLVSWALVVWPHFLFSDTQNLSTLELCAALGLVPATLFGAAATRIFGLPAAAGFLGGSICAATFLYLRLQQVVAFRGVPNVPQPQYPDAWVWLMPLGWIVAVLIVIGAFLKPSEYRIDGSSNEGDPRA